MLRLLTVAMLTATFLAGCSGSDGTDTQTITKGALAANKGGIAGLLIDDIYRPISGASIYLLPLGLTTSTDKSGQFVFTNLDPAAYTLKVESKGHEGAPVTVDVIANDYKEVEFPARRISSEGSRIITTQYSVFIPCAVDFVASGYVLDCTGDTSGDSFRAGFTSDYESHEANVTYLVTEMKANKLDRYEVQVRCEPSDGSDYDYHAVSQFDGDYAKLVMPYNGTSEQSAEGSYGPNVVWRNSCDGVFNTILFSDSAGREELQGAGIPVCCGAGVHLAIKATFVQSLFIGPPQDDVESYAVLA